jgi:uncharacterized membrane protein
VILLSALRIGPLGERLLDHLHSIALATLVGISLVISRFVTPQWHSERFPGKAWSASETHCFVLIGFIGIVVGSSPNFAIIAVSVGGTISTVT